MSKMSTTFRSVSYGPCSRTGVTGVASDFTLRCRQKMYGIIVIMTWFEYRLSC